ncbi:MAG TPA: polysaccharide deacetylase, partial [Myxococcota bacterium]|nr:polysaccharide deacetylase [Myxococcota bacterium]
PLLRSLMPNDEWRWRVFRYPYLREGLVPGVRETIRSHLLRRGYRIAEVTIDFGDWAWNDPFDRCLERGDTRALLALKQSYLKQAVAALRWSVATADDVLKRPIPHVMLLHVGAFDAVMLDALLTRFEQEGVKFITLDEALADPIYSGDTREAGGKLLEQLITTQRLPHTATMPFPEDLLDALCR